MTPSAQQALRRIIENYADTTRFLFACNNSARLIEAIQSRCITMKFSRLSEDQIVTRLKEIQAFKHEGFWQCMDHKLDKDYLEELVVSSKAPWIK